MKTSTLFSRASDEWETPDELFDKLHQEFGFTLDACATEENTKCSRYIDQNADGLLQDWAGETVWCNPPYSMMRKWAQKCYEEGHKPGTTVVMLAPARTDTKWFQGYCLHRAEIRFIGGRLRFSGASENAPFPSVLIIFRGPPGKKKIRKTADDRQVTWVEYERSNNGQGEHNQDL
jgi:site-specific DNA-methyltransferase (adenine-specific)